MLPFPDPEVPFAKVSHGAPLLAFHAQPLGSSTEIVPLLTEADKKADDAER